MSTTPSQSFTMSTQRPFFGNFLAAFRAHSALQKAAASSTQSPAGGPQQPSRTYTTTAPNANASASTTQTSNNVRSTNKTGQPVTTTGSAATAVAAAGQFQSARQHNTTSPYSRSPASPASPGFMNRGATKRRGSDSSTEGFRDAVGEQKWYIGGRTAAGEERFYKLGVVKRVKSIDRLSLDRMSL